MWDKEKVHIQNVVENAYINVMLTEDLGQKNEFTLKFANIKYSMNYNSIN